MNARRLIPLPDDHLSPCGHYHTHSEDVWSFRYYSLDDNAVSISRQSRLATVHHVYAQAASWNSFANAFSSFSLRSEIAKYTLSSFLQLTTLKPLVGLIEAGRGSALDEETAVRLMMWRRRL